MPIIEHDQWRNIHTILIFIVPILINFIEMKYQGKPNSPFDTHPITIFLSIFNLLLYCSLSLPLVTSLPAFNTACGSRTSQFLMVFSLSLSVALLSSLLFRGFSLFLLYMPVLILLGATHLRGLIHKLLYLVKQEIQTVIFINLFRRRLCRGRTSLLLPRTVTDMHIMSESQ
ncbi:hypothetical protein ACJRO7_027724 [Eucalyptus globulus]|uniref:Uncharacterized protein n=1 Tax=Eucalyptus globulus TaxID=34317 RepID=A0ABD3JS48_EUCGL